MARWKYSKRFGGASSLARIGKWRNEMLESGAPSVSWDAALEGFAATLEREQVARPRSRGRTAGGRLAATRAESLAAQAQSTSETHTGREAPAVTEARPTQAPADSEADGVSAAPAPADG